MKQFLISALLICITVIAPVSVQANKWQTIQGMSSWQIPVKIEISPDIQKKIIFPRITTTHDESGTALFMQAIVLKEYETYPPWSQVVADGVGQMRMWKGIKATITDENGKKYTVNKGDEKVSNYNSAWFLLEVIRGMYPTGRETWCPSYKATFSLGSGRIAKVRIWWEDPDEIQKQ